MICAFDDNSTASMITLNRRCQMANSWCSPSCFCYASSPLSGLTSAQCFVQCDAEPAAIEECQQMLPLISGNCDLDIGNDHAFEEVGWLVTEALWQPAVSVQCDPR